MVSSKSVTINLVNLFRNYLGLILKLFISALLVRFLLTRVDLGDIFLHLRVMNPYYFVLGVLCFFIAIAISTKKWSVLLSHTGTHKPFGTLFVLNLISLFYALFLPGGQMTGEAVKIICANQTATRNFQSTAL